MKKLKLLLAFCALMIGWSNANAYTVDDLTSAGWTKVTDITAVTLADNYFMLVDAGTSNYAITNGAPLTNEKPVYYALTNPFAVAGEVWIITESGDNYTLQGIEDNYYFNSGANGWNDSMTEAKTNADFSFTAAEGKYILRSITVGGDNNYVGPWNNDGSVKLTDGIEGVAANKGSAQAPGFYIYAIARTAYNAARRNTAALVSEGWTLVTDVSGLGLAGYYYAILDASETGVESGYALTGTGGRPTYTPLTNPISNKAQLWTSEAHGEGFAFKDEANNKYIYSAASWNMQATSDINTAHTDYIPAYLNDGKWTLSNSISKGEFVGTYSNTKYQPFENEGTASNKAANAGKRQFMFYSIPTIAGDATELPAGGAMEADTWYYFDIAAAADNYTATATELDDIVYTTDGSILLKNEAEVTAKFTAANNSLSATRYYVKSSSANNLEIGVASYSYAVGSPTLSVADGGYTQNSTFTVTFPDAASNDPGAEPALVASSTATVNGNSVDLEATTNGFTLSLGGLTTNTNYVIAIPAGVYGYDGESMNEAINITIHTPAVFDGFYFLRNSLGKYVSRGANYNSRGVLDEFGLPLSVSTDANGITQFTYVDNNNKLFLNGSGEAYTDATSPADWTLLSSGDDFYIVHANEGTYKNKKLSVDAESRLKVDDTGVLFTFEPVSEHNTYMEALKDAQAATAAAALGQSSITTKSALKTWLEENCEATAQTIAAVNFTEKWNSSASAEWGAGKDMYSATVANLPEGLYKLTVNAYYRLNGSATAAEGARGNVYLYGDDVKTQLYSIHDFPAEEGTYSGNTQHDTYGYYPDDGTSGNQATTNGYLTELFVYHNGGDFTYGIHQPSRFSNGQWFGFQKFTLTRYSFAVPATISSTIGVATLYTPYALDFSAVDGLKAYTAEVSGEEVVVTEVENVPANTGVILKGAVGNYNIPVIASSSTEQGDLTGNATDATAWNAFDGFDIYVLALNASGDAQFQKATSGSVAAGKAFLKIAQSSGIKVFNIVDGTATGVEAPVAAEAEEEEILYNTAGVRVDKNYKGIVINQKGEKRLQK